MQEVSRMPGVQGVSAADHPPLAAVLFPYQLYRDGDRDTLAAEALARHVTPSYFDVLRIPLLAGRGFQPGDENRTPVPIIVNKTTADRFGFDQPLGRRLRTLYKDRRMLEIVGIVADARQLGLRTNAGPQIYVPFRYGGGGHLLIHTTDNAGELTGAIRNAVTALDPEIPAPRMTTMDASFDREIAKPRFYLTVLGTFAVVALIIAAVGVYGVVSYGVARRTHELGVRLALGGSPGHILRLVFAGAGRLAAAGLVIGAVGAVTVTRALSSLLYGVEPRDPLTFAAVAILLLAVAAIACYLGARRAISLEPNIALRYE
jgi:putative ABC transport system permease protein